MKHPKRHCVKCDKLQFLVINGSMYHCRKCGESVCGVGDGEPNKQWNIVRDGLDLNSVPSELEHGIPLNAKALACENPDVLSDEHLIWNPRDDESDFRKRQRINKFKVVYQKLTKRQREIIHAVDKFGTHEEAAKALNVSRSLITNTISKISKKIVGNIFSNKGL